MSDVATPTSASAAAPACPLCGPDAQPAVWADADWRVIRVADDDFPAYYRVIAQRHVVEMSDLPAAERARCLELVCAVERVLIDRLRPTKMNLAAFGNMVPHLHWHVIARFDWDSHFPQPLWGARQRSLDRPAAERLGITLPELDAGVRDALSNTAPSLSLPSSER